MGPLPSSFLLDFSKPAVQAMSESLLFLPTTADEFGRCQRAGGLSFPAIPLSHLPFSDKTELYVRKFECGVKAHPLIVFRNSGSMVFVAKDGVTIGIDSKVLWQIACPWQAWEPNSKRVLL